MDVIVEQRCTNLQVVLHAQSQHLHKKKTIKLAIFVDKEDY